MSKALSGSRNLMPSSTNRDQAADSLARVTLAAWRRLRLQLRELRDEADGDAEDTPKPR